MSFIMSSVAIYFFAVRPYKITYLILIHLFLKNKGGRRHFIFIFYLSGHRKEQYLEHIFKIFGKESLLRTRNSNKIHGGGL